MLTKGGTAYVIGAQPPTLTLDVSPAMFLFGQTALRGVYMGSVKFKRDIPLFAELYLQGRFNLDDLLSQEISIYDVNDAYEKVETSGIARSVITRF